MTKQVNMHEAKSKLSELGELVWKGERVLIAKAGKPYLDLLPHKESQKKALSSLSVGIPPRPPVTSENG